MVRLVNESGVGEGTLTLCAHFGEDVAFKSVFPLDFARAGVRESLLGAGVGFHFWHRIPL